MKGSMILLMTGLILAGCATSGEKPPSERTLRPPAGTVPQAAAAVEEGNRLFDSRDWQAAKAQYEAAIQAQPTLAEAHYNLGQTLIKLGDKETAKHHYIEAANLAPGNKVIWNSPPLRKHQVGDSPFKKDKSFIDANPR